MQQLHRVRTQWKRTRTNRLNILRGLLREMGVAIPVGADTAKRRAAELAESLPERLQPLIAALLTEIRELESRMQEVEAMLARYARGSQSVQRLTQVSGIIFYAEYMSRE